MPDADSLNAYTPVEIARRVEAAGETKARMALLPLAMLSVLAGAFIGLGAMLFVMWRSDPSLARPCPRFQKV